MCDVSAQLLEGQLLESAQACVRVQRLIADAPEPLEKADIMNVVRVCLDYLDMECHLTFMFRRITEHSMTVCRNN